jgi:hypothetical protein
MNARLSVVSATDMVTRLAIEDQAEDAGLVQPDQRLTCPVHRRWIHQCVASPVHVNQVTRHRWCRRCGCALPVVVDELTATITIRCPNCEAGGSAATDRLVAACERSIAAARGLRAPAAA